MVVEKPLPYTLERALVPSRSYPLAAHTPAPTLAPIRPPHTLGRWQAHHLARPIAANVGLVLGTLGRRGRPGLAMQVDR